MNNNEEFDYKKWDRFCTLCKWFPDLFLDKIKPETGGISLDLDQRVLIRSICRFISVYGVLPRGWGKTFIEILAAFLCCIFFPNIRLSMSAQTKENAAKILKDKYKEIIRFYPILENEVEKVSFKQNEAIIDFKTGGCLDTLANAQTTKGSRRHRLEIEESALLNNELFDDALSPVVEVPRPTVSVSGKKDIFELNSQINFFTTSGFRGSDEFNRNVSMIKDMIELKGKFVFGGDWRLSSWYGRGRTKAQILNIKANMSSVYFAQNYESKWVGVADSALVNINKLLKCRNLEQPVLRNKDLNEEYYIGVDVARSENTANNQSCANIIHVVRNSSYKIIRLELVYTIGISNTQNFTGQAIQVKKLKYAYNAKMVIVDGNGLGSGLVDELLKEQYDPTTGEKFPCWNTVNTDNQPENPKESDNCLFDIKAQGIQSKIISDFIDCVDSQKLSMLVHKKDSDFTMEEKEDVDSNILPFVQTDFLFEEIANLKLKILSNGALTVEKSVKKMNKDRWSALAYVVYYIMEYENNLIATEESYMDILKEYTQL